MVLAANRICFPLCLADKKWLIKVSSCHSSLWCEHAPSAKRWSSCWKEHTTVFLRGFFRFFFSFHQAGRAQCFLTLLTSTAVLNWYLTYLSAQVVFNSTRFSLLVLRSDPTEGVWEDMCWWLNYSSTSWISTCLCRKRKAEEHVTHSLWTCSHRDISLLISWKMNTSISILPAWANLSQLESGTGIAQLEWCWSPLASGQTWAALAVGLSVLASCSAIEQTCLRSPFFAPARGGKGSLGNTDTSPCACLGAATSRQARHHSFHLQTVLWEVTVSRVDKQVRNSTWAHQNNFTCDCNGEARPTASCSVLKSMQGSTSLAHAHTHTPTLQCAHALGARTSTMH